MNLATIIISSNNSIVSLILWVVGLVLVWAIVQYILTQVPNCPTIAKTVVNILFALILLLLVIDFFFGHQ